MIGQSGSRGSQLFKIALVCDWCGSEVEGDVVPKDWLVTLHIDRGERHKCPECVAAGLLGPRDSLLE